MSIPFSDFQKVELRVATVLAAERVQGSEKLVKLEVDLGDGPPSHEASADAEALTDKSADSNLQSAAGGRQIRQIIAGIGKTYTPEELVDRQIVVVANLEPRKLMGLESQGMLLAASDPDGNPVLLRPDKRISPGADVR